MHLDTFSDLKYLHRVSKILDLLLMLKVLVLKVMSLGDKDLTCNHWNKLLLVIPSQLSSRMTMDVPRVAIDDLGVAIGVPVGWS